jgi:hypothetical protein
MSALAWLRERRARRDRTEEQDGFDFAAGRLLETNGEGADNLLLQADCGDIFGHTPFDDGIKRAVRRWNELRAKR